MKISTAALLATGVVGPATWWMGGASTTPGEARGGPVSNGALDQVAEGFEWFWAINGPVAADAGGDLSVDAAGNVFLAGSHAGLDLDQDGTVDVASGATAYVGARNPLFMKLNKGPGDDRVRLRWIRSPSTPADRSQTKVAADGSGGVFVVGAFMESLSFEDGPTLMGGGGNDAFIARYDGDGGVLWAHVFGGPDGGDAIYGLASDGAGNAYIVGAAAGAFLLDDDGTAYSSDRRAAVLVAYGPDGRVRWQRTLGPGVPFAFNLRVSPAGELYLSGELEGATDFDGDGTTDLRAPRDRDGFVARFDADGTFLGAWALPSPVGLAFGPGGDVFVGAPLGGPVSERYGPVDFDGDGRSDLQPTGGHPDGSWVARYTPDGERRWARSYALGGLNDLEASGDRVVIAGNYTGVRDLDEDGEPERVDRTVDPTLETDLAVLVLSASDGRPERVWTAPGPGNDVAGAVAFLPDQPAVIVTGAIQITADFTGDGEFGEGWVVCENRGDIFFAQYRLPGGRGSAVAEPVPIMLDVSLSEGDVRWRAGLAWTGATGARVDLYQNDELVATVDNNGSHTVLIPKDGFSPPYAYRVCEEGGTRCSAVVEARR